MSAWPEDGKYRGIEIPKRLKRTWDNVSGRWWRQGVDDVLGPENIEQEDAFPDYGVIVIK
jgi:hypothetical protein